MSLADFRRFHNEVINMPRDSFIGFNIKKIKSLAEYLHLIKENFVPDGLTQADIYRLIHKALRTKSVITKNNEFESFFDLTLFTISDINARYNTSIGRHYRHWMELAMLLGLLYKNGSKLVLSDFAEELILADDDLTMNLLREQVLDLNTIDNTYIKQLASSSYYHNLNFRPAIAIIKYLSLINRPATKFELSILFGRPDNRLRNEDRIVSHAFRVSRRLGINQNEQMRNFLEYKGG